MKVSDTTTVLDRDQLRGITLDDEELMREIVAALVDDTARQIELLDSAIREEDAPRCIRLAHYSKGACANVGANAAAAALKQIERRAANREFSECSASLGTLVQEVARLRTEMVAI
ncbi:MAG TPA: Hpt domain-containing protein [Bryobacteraceae bacterium]|nr:Hpt domain-containing protein [Bryobacteraceae bacterium]